MKNTGTIKVNKLKTQFEKWSKKSIGEKITLSLFFLYFLFHAVLALYPFLWVFNNSLKTLEEYSLSPMKMVSSWQFVNYIKVFDQFVVNGIVGYWELLWNSIWQTFVYLIANLFSSMFVAYALAKFRFPGRNFLYGVIIFAQTIPIVGTGGAAFKFRYDIGMYDNPWFFWVSWAVGFDYSAFLIYGTLKSVSNSYAESAEIDGANEWQILWKIIFPQIFPLMLALMVNNFVARWGDFGTSQVNFPSYPNLAYGMYLFQLGSSWAKDGRVIYYASIIISAIPGVVLYALFQNTIIQNMSVGGLKG